MTPTPIANIFYFDDLTLCEGESVALFSSAGTEWHWSNGQVGGELIVDSVENVSVFVIDEYGCQSANSEEINVEYFDAPNTSVSYSSPLEFCDGEDVLLSVTSTPEYEYSWNGQSSNQITITESGEYTCQISNTYCNFQSDLISVIVFDNPTATIYYNSALTFCEGGEVVLSSNQNSIWHWSNNQVGGDLIINENALVSVIIEDSNGCFSESSEEISIEVYDNPEINIESFPNSICSGDSTTIVASGAYAYYWDSFNEDFIQVNDSTIICFPNFTASYQLLIENQYGCSGIMDFEIEVFEVPIIEFDDDIQVCQDSPIEIDLSSLGGSTNWSGIYDLIDSNYLEFTPNESGYLIAVNTNENNCSATDSINVHVLAIDPISIIGSLPPCANSSNQEYIAMPNNYIYDWTIVNGDISIENGNQIIINWHETGSPEIYVGGTDPDNYCSTSLFIETNFNGISPEIVEIQQLFIGSNTLIMSDNFVITNWGYDTPEGESIYFNECSGQYCEFNYLNLSTYSYWAEYGNDLSCLTTSYFNPLSNIVESDLLCQIFPSPFTTNLNIEVEKELFYTIELYSIVGDIIKRVEGISKGFSLETFHLARGTYIIKVFNNNQIIHIQKVIKQ